MHLVLEKFSDQQTDEKLQMFNAINGQNQHLISMEVDGVWFYGLNESQAAVLEQLKIHAD